MMLYMTPRRFLRRSACLSVLAGGLFALGAAPAHAQTYDVSLDTSGLTPGDSYALDLQLNQGAPASASTVSVTSFLFGGGGSADTSNIPQTTGTASGSLSTGVSLSSSDASPVTEFTQNFNNGSRLGFTVDAAQLAAAGAGASPDEFLFDLIDNSVGADGTPVATSDGSGQNSLFTLTRGADGTYAPQNFGYTSAGGTTYTTTSAPSATPELGTVTSLGLLMGLFGVGALRARRGRMHGAAGAEQDE